MMQEILTIKKEKKIILQNLLTWNILIQIIQKLGLLTNHTAIVQYDITKKIFTFTHLGRKFCKIIHQRYK